MKVKTLKPTTRGLSFLTCIDTYNDGHQYDWCKECEYDSGKYVPGDLSKGEIKWYCVSGESNKAFDTEKMLMEQGILPPKEQREYFN